MEVTVVGGGVVGLTAAVTLGEAGHDVTVIAAATGDATTSAVAGALWLPYAAGPREAVTRWAVRTRAWLERLAATEHTAGVQILDVLVIDDGTTPWWSDAVGPIQRITTEAWQFRAPRVDPRRHLPWLERRLARPIRRERVACLADVPGDVVINATGLGARALTGDAALYGLLGQTVVVAPGGIDLQTSISDDRINVLEPRTLFYTIPRDDEVVIGGCARARPDDDPLMPDRDLRNRLLDHAYALGLRPGRILREHVALRPARPTVRLERDPTDPRIIHDYGHGGSGYTLARGCAEDIVALIA